MLDRLLERAKQYMSPADLQHIEEAFRFAETAHQGQLRKSGEPYIKHPTEVAIILAGLHQDPETIIAALLHDVLEDTTYTPDDIKKRFGEQVLFLVEGVTKLTGLKISSREEVHAENMRKMLLAMAKDIRIVFIKLADRLHNMRTLDFLARQNQIDNARETMDIYAPLAHRLGLGLIKWELEDLSFRYLEPEKYADVRDKVADKRREREDYIVDYAKRLQKLLDEHKISGTVSGRPKHFYSIYRKMVTQNLQFEEIYDLLALRVLVKSEQDCYALLGLIHAHWKPVQGKIKDYIAMPKENMYQSLHTTVIGPEGKQVEIQIRTYDMHHLAEYGIASHWLYKETDKTKSGKRKIKKKDKDYIERLSWLRKLTEEGITDGKEFMDTLKTDVLFEEVYVFTPKGDVFSLPVGGTTVDFAYTVHTEVGNHCYGARVNNKLVPLDTELKNGDVIEVLTRNDAHPNSAWLTFVKSSRTKAKIKAWVTKQNRQQHLEIGQRSLQEACKELLVDESVLYSERYMETILKRYTFHTIEDLEVAIGHGDVAARAVVRYFLELYKEKNPPSEVIPNIVSTQTAKQRKANAIGVTVDGIDSIMIKVAHCCHPLPGDQIIGFVTMGYGITVHHADCHNIVHMKERKIDVFWSNTPENKYASVLEVTGFDRVGIFKDMLNVIADKDTSVLEATAKKTNKGEFRAHITVELRDLHHLIVIMDALRKIKDVFNVQRKVS